MKNTRILINFGLVILMSMVVSLRTEALAQSPATGTSGLAQALVCISYLPTDKRHAKTTEEGNKNLSDWCESDAKNSLDELRMLEKHVKSYIEAEKSAYELKKVNIDTFHKLVKEIPDKITNALTWYIKNVYNPCCKKTEK